MPKRVAAVETVKDTTETFQQRMGIAEKAIAATPRFERLAKELGEENVKVSGNDFEIKVGSDPRKLGLVREMFQESNRAQQAMAHIAAPVPVYEATGADRWGRRRKVYAYRNGQMERVQ